MGASPFQIVWKVMLPEAKPSLLVGSAIAVTTILGYTAMSGFVGGGGLGDIAIRYGYHRYEVDIMLVTVAIMVIIVQIFQEVGTLSLIHIYIAGRGGQKCVVLCVHRRPP